MRCPESPSAQGLPPDGGLAAEELESALAVADSGESDDGLHEEVKPGRAHAPVTWLFAFDEGAVDYVLKPPAPERLAKVAARLMEAFAAYTAQTDYEIGRVIDALRQVDQLHNTLVFCIIGDNGASMEGGVYGSFNELASLAGEAPPPQFWLRLLNMKQVICLLLTAGALNWSAPLPLGS